MSDTLRRIKRAIELGNYAFSEKAAIEMVADGVTEHDVATSILNAADIYKTIRSRSSNRHHRVEYLHVIVNSASSGVVVYSKGKLTKASGVELYYFLISSKRAESKS